MRRLSFLFLCALLFSTLSACGAKSRSLPRHPIHGDETFLGIATIEGKNDTNANGVALLHEFEDETAIVGLQVNILPAASGEVYDVWLRGNGTGVNLGILGTATNDARHRLNAELTRSISAMETVTILRRQQSAEPGTGMLVAEGKIQQSTPE